MGNTTSLVMISDNNILLRLSPTAPEDKRLTDTGVPGIIYNGVPDWLYQEEVLPNPNVLWPSLDGKYLLYACFNDTAVNFLIF